MQSANPIVDFGTLIQDARHGPLPLLLIVLIVVTELREQARTHEGGKERLLNFRPI